MTAISIDRSRSPCSPIVGRSRILDRVVGGIRHMRRESLDRGIQRVAAGPLWQCARQYAGAVDAATTAML